MPEGCGVCQTAERDWRRRSRTWRLGRQAVSGAGPWVEATSQAPPLRSSTRPVSRPTILTRAPAARSRKSAAPTALWRTPRACGTPMSRLRISSGRSRARERELRDRSPWRPGPRVGSSRVWIPCASAESAGSTSMVRPGSARAKGGVRSAAAPGGMGPPASARRRAWLWFSMRTRPSGSGERVRWRREMLSLVVLRREDKTCWAGGAGGQELIGRRLPGALVSQLKRATERSVVHRSFASEDADVARLGHRCSHSGRSARSCSRSKTFTVWSYEAQARPLPSGLNATALTQPM